MEISIIVRFWEIVFSFLKHISIFDLIRQILNLCNRKMSYKFVDIWILCNFFGAIILSYVIKHINWQPFIYAALVYGALRIFEILIYQINVVLFDPFENGAPKASYKIKSVQRMVIALFMNYIEIVFWFAAILLSIMKLSNEIDIPSWSCLIKENLLTVMAFSPVEHNELTKTHEIFSTVITIEVIAGLIMTLVSLARFIGLLPKISQIDNEN